MLAVTELSKRGHPLDPLAIPTRAFYEGITMTKFNNLNVKRVKSNLKYSESKLVKKKKDHGERKKH